MTDGKKKLVDTYALRISHKTKVFTNSLSPVWKKKLNHELRLTIARLLHEANFNPWDYMDPSEDDERSEHGKDQA